MWVKIKMVKIIQNRIWQKVALKCKLEIFDAMSKIMTESIHNKSANKKCDTCG